MPKVALRCHCTRNSSCALATSPCGTKAIALRPVRPAPRYKEIADLHVAGGHARGRARLADGQLGEDGLRSEGDVVDIAAGFLQQETLPSGSMLNTEPTFAHPGAWPERGEDGIETSARRKGIAWTYCFTREPAAPSPEGAAIIGDSTSHTVGAQNFLTR